MVCEDRTRVGLASTTSPPNAARPQHPQPFAHRSPPTMAARVPGCHSSHGRFGPSNLQTTTTAKSLMLQPERWVQRRQPWKAALRCRPTAMTIVGTFACVKGALNMVFFSKRGRRWHGSARPNMSLASVVLILQLSACGGGDDLGPRVAIGKDYSYVRLLPPSERPPTGIDAYTEELTRAGLHPESAACAFATKAISGGPALQYPRQVQVISFTIPASESERALALGYYPLADYSVFYDLNNPKPCSAD